MTTRRASKKELIEKYFMQAYETASGGYLVTARQIFYVLRQVINLEHGGWILKQSDYSAFTQQHVTAMIKRYPELEEKIPFERRGVFIEPLPAGSYPWAQKISMNSSAATAAKSRCRQNGLKPTRCPMALYPWS